MTPTGYQSKQQQLNSETSFSMHVSCTRMQNVNTTELCNNTICQIFCNTAKSVGMSISYNPTTTMCSTLY